jgi:hypothetical protein
VVATCLPHQHRTLDHAQEPTHRHTVNDPLAVSGQGVQTTGNDEKRRLLRNALSTPPASC